MKIAAEWRAFLLFVVHLYGGLPYPLARPPDLLQAEPGGIAWRGRVGQTIAYSEIALDGMRINARIPLRVTLIDMLKHRRALGPVEFRGEGAG